MRKVRVLDTRPGRSAVHPEMNPVVQAFLDRADLFAVVATVNADGTPHQAVTWFERRGDAILVNGRADRRWIANVLRTGWISVCAASGYEYVLMTGSPRVDRDPDRALADIRSLARRYGEPESDFDAQSRVTVVLTPARIAVHGKLTSK
jgi:hypothetical protein